MSETTPFWLALTRIDGLGIRGCHKLIQHFGSPQAAYMASLTELESCGVPARVAQAIFAQTALKDAEREVREIAKADCELVVFRHALLRLDGINKLYHTSRSGFRWAPWATIKSSPASRTF